MAQSRRFGRRAGALALPAVLVLFVTFVFPQAAHAAQSVSARPDLPASVTVGDSAVAGSLQVANESTAPDNTLVWNITYVKLALSCAGGNSGGCTDPDTGVFSAPTSGVGRVNTLCAGATFNFTTPDASGVQTLEGPSLSLGSPGAVSGRCTVDFTVNVLKLPATDVDPATAGVQTDAFGFLDADSATGGHVVDSVAKRTVTVTPAGTSTSSTSSSSSSTSSSTSSSSTSSSSTTTTTGGSTTSSSSTSTSVAGSTPTATASPNVVVPGQATTVSGGNFPPNASLTVVLQSDPVRLSTTSADALGTFSSVVTVPAGTTAGTHELVVSGGGKTVTVKITVTGSAGALVRTGSDSHAGLRVAAWAVGAGVVLLLLGAGRKVSHRQNP